MAGGPLTVKQAYDAMMAIGNEEQSLVDQALLDGKKAAPQQFMHSLAEPEERKVSKFGIGIAKDIFLEQLKACGGFWGYLAWSIKGLGAAKDIAIVADAAQAGKVLGKSVLKLGAAASVVGLIGFAMDVGETVALAHIKGKTKKAKKEFDKEVDAIFSAYGQIRDRLSNATQALLDRVENTRTIIVKYYSQGKGKSYLLASKDATKNEVGRKVCQAIVAQGLVSDLKTIHELENELFEFRRLTSNFVSQARIALSYKSEPNAGFPNYEGAYNSNRPAMFKSCISEIQPFVDKVIKAQNGLNATAFNLNTLVGLALESKA